MSGGRVATVAKPHQLDISATEVPAPAPGHVVVKIRYCGVCGTDVHGFATPEMLPPAVFGHEWTGTVVAAGPAVGTVTVGQRVTVAVGPPCGTCAMCRAGYAEQCDTAFAEANGVTPDAPTHGGFATHLAVSERRVVPVLDELSDEQAGLVEPTAVTFHAVKRTAFRLGSTVVVQGAGPIGLLTAQHARAAGAGRTIISEPVEARRQAARAVGFTEVFEPGNGFTDAILEATAGLGADVVFECTGVAGLLQPSASLVRRGGTLSLLGYPITDSSVSYGDWQSRELRVIGSLAYNHEDFLGAMRALASGAVDVAPLITGTVGLDGLAEVLTDLASGNTSHAKVLVDPER
ncbi:MAG TPA: alcohol dehydrogenase catalytic domain-containing protein [Acidimicrobiales bacterium]|nr:alcohol dehydrogenase catalytic domain-containing protein [Acidimicrobiales bacterium]